MIYKWTTINKIKIMRTKFNVAEVTKYGNGGGLKVTLFPVMAAHDVNKSLWTDKPDGRIELHITNPDVDFTLGEYYIDITKIEKNDSNTSQ